MHFCHIHFFYGGKIIIKLFNFSYARETPRLVEETIESHRLRVRSDWRERLRENCILSSHAWPFIISREFFIHIIVHH